MRQFHPETILIAILLGSKSLFNPFNGPGIILPKKTAKLHVQSTGHLH